MLNFNWKIIYSNWILEAIWNSFASADVRSEDVRGERRQPRGRVEQPCRQGAHLRRNGRSNGFMMQLFLVDRQTICDETGACRKIDNKRQDWCLSTEQCVWLIALSKFSFNRSRVAGCVTCCTLWIISYLICECFDWIGVCLLRKLLVGNTCKQRWIPIALYV